MTINKLKKSKRHALLLEVVIALALVALCILPLLVPHAMILTRQQRFMNEVDLDHLVNLLYADVTQRLYANEIPWNSLVNKVSFEVDAPMLERVKFKGNLPFKGVYQFIQEKHKPKKDSPYSIYLFALEFRFNLENQKTAAKPLTFRYEIFLIRYLETGELEILEADEVEVEEENGGGS